MFIKDKKDLQLAYLIIKDAQEFKEKGHLTEGETLKIVNRVKKGVREYYKKEDGKQKRHIIKDDGIDGYVEEVELPAEIKTMEQAEDYFDACERLYYHPSAYDCTGQAFTSSHFITWIRGRLVLCHSVHFDV